MSDLHGNILLLMKENNNYRTEKESCRTCNYYQEDMSTDNFGTGDHCERNPDARFSVQSTAICDRHLKKGSSNTLIK